ncbi:hypothetical protein P691DRAFT_808748 [Macrolepiota fuliginosa MF-IS2]|uniref:Uncharacterized protein n=1 Tax=Macrolepiota fuliginosa MF-IS2 TaxID=1400762 RepID=A0A9P5X379_9AGAR|nr:hypothetical protein P691DRAFT_808748 [Macrolepiota fuliginosa MF-IS2]
MIGLVWEDIGVLPHLRELEVAVTHITYDRVTKETPLLDATIRMLESRRRRRDSLLVKFSLAVTKSAITNVWQRHHQGSFSRLVRDGLHVNITQYMGDRVLRDVPIQPGGRR